MGAPDFTTPDSPGVSPDSIPITPDDVKDLYRPCRFMRADVGGTVRCITLAGRERTLKFADGETRFVVVTKVFSTGTTAGGLEGMP